MNRLNIMIVGVGGQGTLLTSRVLGNIALKLNLDVKVSEVHGMAQRGGSVVTYVKMGEKVYSPIIEKGEADILLCFEELEALRWLDYVKENGKIIINEQKINPMPVIIGAAKYPESILEKIRKNYKNVATADAISLARESGNIKTVNTVMLSIMAKSMDISKDIWLDAIKETVPAKFLDVNIKAFELGFNLTNN